MQKIVFVVLAFFFTLAWANEKTYDFNFKDKELTDIVKVYSDLSQKKFVFDGSFRGKATILSPVKVT